MKRENHPDHATGEWTIWADCQITRRKYYHIVADPAGRGCYRSRSLADCAAFLEAEGVEAYRIALVGETGRWLRCETVNEGR